MVDRSAQAAVGGCLARVFSLFGFFLLVSGIFATIRNLDAPGGGIEFTGALLPGLALIAMGRLIRRRVNRSAASELDGGPIPSPTPRTRVDQPSPAPPPTTPIRPVPNAIAEVLEDEPVDEGLEAIEDLDIDDFKPGQQLSSEERIKRARDKYQKRP
jgi:hypothetical protein